MTQLTDEGSLVVSADAAYASLATALLRQAGGARLPVSVWAPQPVSSAPLGPRALGATAATLATTPALAAYHKVIVSTVGITPAASPTGAPGIAGTGCDAPASTVPSGTPTQLPPTSTVAAQVTVTNCGTVAETGLTVSATLVTVSAPGGGAAGAGRSVSTSRAVSLGPRSSTGLALSPLPVGSGGAYTLTVAVSVPPDQAQASGSSQQFALAIAP